MPKAPQDDSHDCDQQHHHNDQPLYQRLALVGKKSSSDVTFYAQLMSEHAEDLRYKPCATVDLSCPCHTRAKPNVTSNATITSWYWQWLSAQLCSQLHQKQHGWPALRMLSCFKGRGNMPCSCRHCVLVHLVFDEITNTLQLTPCATPSHLSPPRRQSPLGQWQKWKYHNKKNFIEPVVTAVAMQKSILTGIKHEKYMWFASWLIL